MNSIVFSLRPKSLQDGSWIAAKNDIRQIVSSNKNIEELGEGSWLIHEEKSFPCLGQLIASSEAENCPYKVVIVHDGIKWNRTF